MRLISWQRELWRAFWRQYSVVIPLALTVVALVAIWFLAINFVNSSADLVTLRYSLYIGSNWLASPREFLFLPLAATLCIAIDLVLSYLVGRRTIIIRYLFLWASVGTAVGFLWLVMLLISFNS